MDGDHTGTVIATIRTSAKINLTAASMTVKRSGSMGRSRLGRAKHDKVLGMGAGSPTVRPQSANNLDTKGAQVYAAITRPHHNT